MASPVEEGRKSGHTFSQPDLFIAATALHHGMTVVSRDTRITNGRGFRCSIRGNRERTGIEIAGPSCDASTPERGRASLRIPG